MTPAIKAAARNRRRAMSPMAEIVAREKLSRIAGRQAPGRWALWGSVAVVAGLYLGLAAVTFTKGWNGVCGWSLFAMAVVPAWASLVVILSCATTFPAEREAGTLDGLMLTPLSAKTVVEALMRPRLKLGLIVLVAGAPFYLMPHGATGGIANDPEAHILLLSTFCRPFFGALVVDVSMVTSHYQAHWWPSFLSGPATIFIDATRLYAFAAIATAVSIRARTTARSVFWALFFGALFILATVAAEWGGFMILGLLARFTAISDFSAFFVLAGLALSLEACVGNLVVPRKILNAGIRRADNWLTDRP